MKKVFLSAICLAVLLCIASCSSDPVSVSLNGGSMDLVIDDKTKLETVSNAIPVKDGYVFAGWYSDSSFSNYIRPGSVTKEQKKLGTAYAKWIDIPEINTYTVRRDQVTVTDSGRENQQLDCVGISGDYNVKDLQRAGYTSLNVKLTALISEKDDGYQYIFFYKNTECNSSDINSISDFYDKYVFGEDDSDPNLLYGQRFDHGATGVDTSWNLVTVETNIPIHSLERELYIRYGASGKDNDTWYNKEITVEITPVGGPVNDGGDAEDGNVQNGNGGGTSDPELDAFLALVKTAPEKDGHIFIGWYSDDRFTDYIDPYYVLPEQKEKKTAFPRYISSSVVYEVRTDSVTVTDSGRGNQQLDTVIIGTDFPALALIRAGYRYLSLEITMQISEKNDGYQYVFVYANSTSTGDDGLLYSYEHDHGGSGVSGWSTVTFRASVPIDELNGSIYLRYGASGKDEDTWYNRNVKVTVTATK